MESKLHQDPQSLQDSSPPSGSPQENRSDAEPADGELLDEIVRPMYIVGIGASAGGLEALERLFQKMPADTGMAFIVVQHLSPDFKSVMNELLARWTEMPILAAENRMFVAANTIYLMPPKTEMIISDGRLLLTSGKPKDELRLPIDQFFRSLARDAGPQAIAIVLSGTGSDGSRGIRDVHQAGGLVIAQTEETAKFDGMPKSAIETGFVHAILAPEEIPPALLRHIHHPSASAVPVEDQDGMSPVFRLLRDQFQIDFSHYKPSTVLRRTERRMQLIGLTDLELYVDRLRHDRDELDALYRDLLIGVTSFFRDADGFRFLEQRVLLELIEKVQPGEEFRVWVAGCATGEEAYSLAILIQEQLRKIEKHVLVKIFATDVHRRSLEIAAQGVYTAEAVEAVNPRRLQEFFIKTPEGYRICPELRNMVVFAPHNIIKDAPFTRLNLITCRNLLIYLTQEVQKKVLCLFHFGLKTGGILWLGPSETTGDLANEFETVDQHWKFYRKRRDVRLTTDLRLPLSSGIAGRPWISTRIEPASQEAPLNEIFTQILEETFHAAVLVNERLEVERTFGEAHRFLRFNRGVPTLQLLDLLPRELRTVVSAAIHRAQREKEQASFSGVVADPDKADVLIDVIVLPLSGGRRSAPHLLIRFEDSRQTQAAGQPVSNIMLADATREHLDSVEAELRHTKENLQATIQELETSNEELQATNEELLASNEELQSTNEELHSVNEELYTVNAEYQKKIDELTELTRDMDNLLLSTDVHTIFLDDQLRIRKFTPRMAEVFHLIPADVGRRIHGFVYSIQCPDLPTKLEHVLESGEPLEEEVRTTAGTCFLMRILPYIGDTEHRGVVLTLVDITSLAQAEARFSNAVEVSPNGMLMVNELGVITMVNSEIERIFRYSPNELIGQPLETLLLGSEQTRHRELRNDFFKHPRRIRQMGGGSYVWGRRKDGSQVPLDVRVNPIETPMGMHAIASLVDMTEHQKLESTLVEQVMQRDRFLATLSHELRNPVGAILTSSSVLHRICLDHSDVQQPIEVIRRQASHIARLLDDLLDVARVTQGKIELRREPVDLILICRDSLEAVTPLAERHQHAIRITCPAEPVYVYVDRVRMLQILENLLTNAIKYTPDGGQISLELTVESQQAVLRVQDNGCGMSSELLTSIFDMFVQSDNTLDRSHGGMGVGLTLVKSLVEMHGGTITAHSEGHDRGSVFEVRLPLTELRPSAQPNETSLLDVGQVRLVLVEDIADARVMLESLLRLEGYQVLATAANGWEGLDVIRRFRPDVALVDIGLPGLDGYQLARRLRDEIGSSVRLVALTGYGRQEDHEAVIDAGFDGHLVKPVNIQTLNSTVAHLLTHTMSTSQARTNEEDAANA